MGHVMINDGGSMNLGLKNRRALVMGGTKGLGRSIADTLAEEGAPLTISGRDQARLDEAAALRARGVASAIGVVADVASGEAMDRLAEEAVAAMGGVDILVLNHGGPPQCTASEMTEDQLVEWFQRIVVSPIRIANTLLPAMRVRTRGQGALTAHGWPANDLAVSRVWPARSASAQRLCRLGGEAVSVPRPRPG